MHSVVMYNILIVSVTLVKHYHFSSKTAASTVSQPGMTRSVNVDTRQT